jgi:hypothetical protein
MSITLSITNFRALKLATLALKKITFVAGRNEAGKTCIMQALAAATTGQVIPIEDVSKTQVHRFIHDGATEGEIILRGDDWQTRILYPSCETTASGTPLTISRVAAGLDSILDYDKKTRVAKLSEMINALPSIDDVKAAFKAFSEADFNEAWATIEKISWDQAHRNAMASRTELTGEWKAGTGQVYGVRIADGWLPAEWIPDLDMASEDGLKQQLKTCQDFLLTAQTSQAVSDAEVATLKSQAAALPQIEKDLLSCGEILTATKKSAGDIANILDGLPKAEQPSSCACPHCGKSVHINGRSLEKIVPLSIEEIQKRAKNYQDCQESLTSANVAVANQSRKFSELQAKKIAADNAVTRLEKLAKRKDSVSPEKIKELQDKVFLAQDRLAAWQKKHRADDVFKKIQTAQSIVDILSPDGIRLDILKTKLGTFNKILSAVCSAAQWPMTELLFDKDSISISYDGRNYGFASESAQFRARVCLQIATALQVDDGMVLIDRADILDVPGRNGLFRLLQGLKISAVVGMTVTKDQAQTMSTISKIGGVIYWIENGEAVELNGTPSK